MDDPLREVWFRIHRYDAPEPYSPSNVEARRRDAHPSQA